MDLSSELIFYVVRMAIRIRFWLLWRWLKGSLRGEGLTEIPIDEKEEIVKALESNL